MAVIHYLPFIPSLASGRALKLEHKWCLTYRTSDTQPDLMRTEFLCMRQRENDMTVRKCARILSIYQRDVSSLFTLPGNWAQTSNLYILRRVFLWVWVMAASCRLWHLWWGEKQTGGITAIRPQAAVLAPGRWSMTHSANAGRPLHSPITNDLPGDVPFVIWKPRRVTLGRVNQTLLSCHPKLAFTGDK